MSESHGTLTVQAGEEWAPAEVDVLLRAYVELLFAELGGARPNKRERLRELEKVLPARSRGAIEYKMQNTSAVLHEEGLPWIDGYKPAVNYQHALRARLTEQLDGPEALRTRLEAVQLAVRNDDPLEQLRTSDVAVPPPSHQTTHGTIGHVRGWPGAISDAANRRLGRAGEDWICELEKRELAALGRSDLASRVEPVAQTRGDGLGYDVLSFDPTSAERWIEVKTTNAGPSAPFMLTANELAVWRAKPECYWLFRVYWFGGARRLYRLHGDPDETITVTTAVWQARPR